MYESHWNLSARPFENRYTVESYYPSEAHQAAILKIRYAIEHRRSVAVVCGQSGMGKSLVLHQLRHQLPSFAGPTIQVAYPALSPDQLVQYIACQLDSEFRPDSVKTSMADAIRSLERSLAKIVQEGRHAVLVLDEAEWLEDQGSLNTLRLLLNLSPAEAAGESAFTIILSGQPTLLAQLERFPALDQRVAVRCILNRFSVDETNAYIGHRLRAVGGNLDTIFQPESLDAIHNACEGVPRRINSLCDLALMVGYAQELDSIPLSLIENVHRELAPID